LCLFLGLCALEGFGLGWIRGWLSVVLGWGSVRGHVQEILERRCGIFQRGSLAL